MADEWRCPDCGARVQPRDVTRHHGECAAAVPDPTEDEQNEERGDIAMALRGFGFEDIADDVDGCTIEDARATYFEVVGVEWNWEAQRDTWTVQAMRTAAALDPEFDPEHTYDPYGSTKHRYYEEN